MNLHSLFLTFLIVAGLQAEIPITDTTVVPGLRVGAIEKGMTLTGLKSVFGGGAVNAVVLPGPEGSEIDGARMFVGTDREVEIIFNPEGNEREIWEVKPIGKAWKFENGLKLGLSLEEVEKINGKAFKVWGFDWDLGGWADLTGGRLEGKVSIRLEPSAAASEELSGDKQIASTDKKLRAAKPKVSELTVLLR
jgi:hypothetical protein